MSDFEATVIPSTSAAEFLNNLSPQGDRIDETDHTDMWVYRGHHDANWKLTPAAWREDGQQKLLRLSKRIKPRVIEIMRESSGQSSVPPEIENKVQYRCELYIELITEIYAVKQFCNLADEIQVLIPDVEKVFELPEIIEYVVSGSLSHFVGARPRENSELFLDVPFAVAQHHGIPTRYMDWTRNPLIAAFFASESPTAGLSESCSPDICVWAVNRAVRMPGSETRWVRVPRAFHGYVHAQSGVSLFCGSHFGHKWDSFPKIPQKKFTLPRQHISELRRILLTVHRISKAHLMPSLDNV
ncbi:MAG: FRG domain-containing protein, partial [Tepidisphaeraceae bacterium]